MVLAMQDVHERIRTSASRSCTEGLHTLSFHAMGTACQVLYIASSRHTSDYFTNAALEWLAAFEAKYSRFLPNSLICSINEAAGIHPVQMDDELVSLLRLCDWFHWVTDGIFDPTALPLIRLWDYKSDNPTVPAPQRIEEALSLVRWRNVERNGHEIFLPKKGMAIDIGGIGKEYAVDRVVEMASEAGIDNILVDFGRDIRAQGSPPEGGPWRIGLEDPTDPGTCRGGLALTNLATATSGSYLRFFWHEGKRYGHILDPRTGYPTDNDCRAVSVIAPTCTEAGILSTTAFVRGPEEGLRIIADNQQAEGMIWTERHQLQTGRWERYEL